MKERRNERKKEGMKGKKKTERKKERKEERKKDVLASVARLPPRSSARIVLFAFAQATIS